MFSYLRRCRFSTIREKIQQERSERLKSLPTTTQEKIRNFGIIAHIDAGKTTTTERMLYYAGAIPFPGEVHDGTTTMDFMPQERQRGITIRSAAISFNWANYQYNLIDTPGHIDFTAEVERSLRVLAIFDGVSGVQTQTETVWVQANKFNIPRIVFVNKMDRAGASLEYTIESILQRLRVKPLIMQIPVGEAEQFSSVIDLVSMEQIDWIDKYGNEQQRQKIDKSHPFYFKAIQQRDVLLGNLSEFDEQIAELYLEESDQLLNQELLYSAIRKALNSNPLRTCPIYIGSSLKNRGIQPLMDAVHMLLPGPSERPAIFDVNNPTNKRKLDKSERLTAYVYKILQDNDFGRLGFARIYSGSISSKSQYYNSTYDETVKIQNIFRVRANRYVNINDAQAGDIVAIQAKQIQPGITLVGSGDERFILQKLELPQSVFYAGLEYESAKDKQKLDQALEQLALEDDSLKVIQEDGAQIVLGGQGELHLEIILQRLKEDFGLNCQLMKMEVQYKESISQEGVHSVHYQDFLKGKPLDFSLTLKLEPNESQENEIVFDFERSNEFDIAYKEYKSRLAKDSKDVSVKYLKNPCKQIEIDVIQDEYGEERVLNLSSLSFSLFHHLESTILASLNRGYLKSFQMFGVKATIIDGSWTIRRTTELAIGRCVSKLIQEIGPCLKPIIMEPIMSIEISCPHTLAQKVMNDFVSQRRGKISEMNEDNSRIGQRTLIKGTIPLQETIGYSTQIRSFSQGEAYFVMNYKEYDFVGGVKQQQILEQI